MPCAMPTFTLVGLVGHRPLSEACGALTAAARAGRD